MTAPAMDFVVKDGRQLELAETSGPPQIVIAQPPEPEDGGYGRPVHGEIHGQESPLSPARGAECEDRQLSATGQPDRVSTSPNARCVVPAGGRHLDHHAGRRAYLRERAAKSLGTAGHVYGLPIRCWY